MWTRARSRSSARPTLWEAGQKKGKKTRTFGERVQRTTTIPVIDHDLALRPLQHEERLVRDGPGRLQK